MSHSATSGTDSSGTDGGWQDPTTPESGGMSGKSFGILGLSLLCAAIYYAFGSLDLWLETRLWVGAKWLSVASLAVLAWTRLSTKGAMLLGLGLALHSIGDVLIALAPLEWAIVAFGFGHLAYLALFVYVGLTPKADRVRITTAVVVLLAGAGFLAWLLPRLGEGTAVPIVVYSAAIVAMALLATQVRRGQPWVGLGGVSYLLSDGIISVDLFVHQLPWADAATWPLYYLGQLAIACGILWGHERLAETKSDVLPVDGVEPSVETEPMAADAEKESAGEDLGQPPSP